jgi:hypothetical protein
MPLPTSILTMNSKIYAPSLYLFAYQDAVYSSRNIHEKCNDILEKLSVSDLKFFKKNNIDNYPGQRQVESSVKTDKDKDKNNSSFLSYYNRFEGKVFLETKNYNFHGFTYSLRIDDTYAIGLQASRPHEEYGEKTEDSDTVLLSKLNTDNCFLPELNENSIHQTILITAWLPENTSQRDWKYLQLLPEGKIVAEKVANDCVKDFLHLSENQANNQILKLGNNQTNTPQAYRQDILLGSSIFEYRVSRGEENFIHILVWLFCDKETEKLLLDYYKDFLLLFIAQRQIFQAYYQSRCDYNLLQTYHEQIHSFSLGLLQLDKDENQDEQYESEHQIKKMMELSREYHLELQSLKRQQYIIEAGARKYEYILNDLQQKLSIRQNRQNFVVNDELKFLEDGRREFCDYIQHIKADYDYFAISSPLLNHILSGLQSLLIVSQITTVSQIKDSQIKDSQINDLQIATVNQIKDILQIKDSQIKDSQINDLQIATAKQIQDILQIKDSQINDLQIATAKQIKDILQIKDSQINDLQITTANQMQEILQIKDSQINDLQIATAHQIQDILQIKDSQINDLQIATVKQMQDILKLLESREERRLKTEKEQSRHLGNTIIIVGTAVAATQLTTTVSSQLLTPTPKSNSNQSLSNYIFLIALSITIGIVCGYVAAWLLKIKD